MDPGIYDQVLRTNQIQTDKNNEVPALFYPHGVCFVNPNRPKRATFWVAPGFISIEKRDKERKWKWDFAGSSKTRSTNRRPRINPMISGCTLYLR